MIFIFGRSSIVDFTSKPKKLLNVKRAVNSLLASHFYSEEENYTAERVLKYSNHIVTDKYVELIRDQLGCDALKKETLESVFRFLLNVKGTFKDQTDRNNQFYYTLMQFIMYVVRCGHPDTISEEVLQNPNKYPIFLKL